MSDLDRRYQETRTWGYGRYDLQKDLELIREAIQDRESLEEQKRLFEQHRAAMALAVKDCAKLVASIQADRKLIEAKLSVHNPNGEIAVFWAELARAEKLAAVVTKIQWDWEFGAEPNADALGGKSPSTVRFPQYYTENDVDSQREALAATGATGDIENFHVQLLDAKDFGAKFEALEDDIASSRFVANTCLLHAIDWYSRLPGENVVGASDPSGPDTWTDPEDTKLEEAPDTVPYIVSVVGAGWVPHYAGGSFIISGSNTQVLWIHRDVSAEEAIEKLRLQMDGQDICDEEVPAIPGLNKRPTIWNNLVITKVRGPILDKDEIADMELESNWTTSDDDGPSLGELRKRGNCN